MNMQEIDINLKPSKQYILLTASIFIINIGVIYSLNMPLLIKVGLAAMVLIYIAAIVWRHVLLRSKKSIIKLMFDEKGCHLGNHLEHFPAVLCGDSTITTWLCILRFKSPGHRFKLVSVIFRDAIDPDQYRRMLVV